MSITLIQLQRLEHTSSDTEKTFCQLLFVHGQQYGLTLDSSYSRPGVYMTSNGNRNTLMQKLSDDVKSYVTARDLTCIWIGSVEITDKDHV